MIDKAIELSKEVNAIWSVEDCKLIHKALLQAKEERKGYLEILQLFVDMDDNKLGIARLKARELIKQYRN